MSQYLCPCRQKFRKVSRVVLCFNKGPAMESHIHMYPSTPLKMAAKWLQRLWSIDIRLFDSVVDPVSMATLFFSFNKLNSIKSDGQHSACHVEPEKLKRRTWSFPFLGIFQGICCQPRSRHTLTEWLPNWDSALQRWCQCLDTVRITYSLSACKFFVDL